MRTSRLLLVAAVLLVIGLGVVGSAWKGSAGFNIGWPSSANSIRFAGEASGLPALVGIIAIPVGLLMLVISTITAIVEGSRRT